VFSLRACETVNRKRSTALFMDKEEFNGVSPIPHYDCDNVTYRNHNSILLSF